MTTPAPTDAELLRAYRALARAAGPLISDAFGRSSRSTTMTTTKPLQIHVTRVNGSDVYGHEARLCDEGGCGAHEAYFSDVDAEEHNVQRGQLIEWDATARIVWLLSEV